LIATSLKVLLAGEREEVCLYSVKQMHVSNMKDLLRVCPCLHTFRAFVFDTLEDLLVLSSFTLDNCHIVVTDEFKEIFPRYRRTITLDDASVKSMTSQLVDLGPLEFSCFVHSAESTASMAQVQCAKVTCDELLLVGETAHFVENDTTGIAKCLKVMVNVRLYDRTEMQQLLKLWWMQELFIVFEEEAENENRLLTDAQVLDYVSQLAAAKNIFGIVPDLSIFKGTKRNEMIESTLRPIVSMEGLDYLGLFDFRNRSVLFQCGRLRWSVRHSEMTDELRTDDESLIDHINVALHEDETWIKSSLKSPTIPISLLLEGATWSSWRRYEILRYLVAQIGSSECENSLH